jgi:serine/threonine protein kinase
MNYFDSNVLNILATEGIKISPQEIQAYTELCDFAQRRKKEGKYFDQKTQKNQHQLRPYSVWHMAASPFNTDLNHWLVLSGSKNWETKDHDKPKNMQFIVTKLVVNIVTGEKQFVKIRRPESKVAAQHVMDTFVEAQNNRIMNVKAEDYTRYSLQKGTKGYVFQPYRGKLNLLDLLQNPSTSSKTLLNLLVTSGVLLQRMHTKGYLHTDFKPQNVVVNDNQNSVSLVDFEFMTSVSTGKRGKNEMHGTLFFCHKDWVKEGKESQELKLPIYYTAHNDVYAFLVTASLFISQAHKREKDEAMKNTFLNMLHLLDHWKQLPFKDMPNLREVIACLRNESTQNSPQSKKKIAHKHS